MGVLEGLLRGAAHLAAPGGRRGRLTILFFHGVHETMDPLHPLVPEAAGFDAQMALLSRTFHVLPLGEAIEQLEAGALPPRAASITFDDGYRNNLTVACPILRRHGLTATFFVASGFVGNGRMYGDTVAEVVRRLDAGTVDLTWLGLGCRPVGDIASRVGLIEELTAALKYLPIAERAQACERLERLSRERLPDDLMLTEAQIRELARSGMTIGGHTVNHPILSRIPLAQARYEIEHDRATLASIVGSAPSLFAYPNGKPSVDFGSEHVALVQAAGYRAAVTTAWGVALRGNRRYRLPRVNPGEADPLRFVGRLLAGAARARRRQPTAGIDD
jgi:peptidoglycan/xylan/chitin deacetylase (PgdA/CDA1 family)